MVKIGSNISASFCGTGEVQVPTMSSSNSGFENFLTAMQGAQDRHAATYYCFGTDEKDKIINPAETFNQFLKDAPKPGKGGGKGK